MKINLYFHICRIFIFVDFDKVHSLYLDLYICWIFIFVDFGKSTLFIFVVNKKQRCWCNPVFMKEARFSSLLIFSYDTKIMTMKEARATQRRNFLFFWSPLIALWGWVLSSSWLSLSKGRLDINPLRVKFEAAFQKHSCHLIAQSPHCSSIYFKFQYEK